MEILSSTIDSVSVEAKHKPEIDLPQHWREAIRLVNDISTDTGIPYAIVGSLGIAATCNEKWKPINTETGVERDLDVYVLGNAQERELFHKKIVETRKENMPQIDSHMLFGRDIVFDNQRPSIAYKDDIIQLDADLFKVNYFDIDDIRLPLLGAQTHLALLRVYNRKYLPKIKARVDSLTKFIKTNHRSADLLRPEKFKPLVNFQKKLESEYLFRKRSKIVRQLRESPIVDHLANAAKAKFPKAWEKLRKTTKS